MILTCHLPSRLVDSPLSTSLCANKTLRVIHLPEASHIDCTPFPGCGIVFVPATALSDPHDDQLAALMEMETGLLIVETSPRSWELFRRLQQISVVEYGVAVVPVESVEHAARYISVLINQHAKPAKAKIDTTASITTGKTDNPHALLIKTVSGIPGIGEAKAKELLMAFGTLKSISEATESDIRERIKGVGAVQAAKVVAFFQSNPF
ncbi:hypothetical protein HDU98_010959 [Podochytrium sp. JEL0797]|nr:hypothetical protein HDU98_010959 [Podochytrium sp. JEL0797]